MTSVGSEMPAAFSDLSPFSICGRKFPQLLAHLIALIPLLLLFSFRISWALFDSSNLIPNYLLDYCFVSSLLSEALELSSFLMHQWL